MGTRLFAAVVVSLGHLALLWLVIGSPGWPRAPGPDATPSTAQATNPERPSDDTRAPEARSGAASAATAPSQVTTIESSPAPDPITLRAAAYERQRLAAIDRVRRRRYGDVIADAMQLPLPEAWSTLESLAIEGDRVAGDALIEMSTTCDFSGSWAKLDHLPEKWGRGLPADDAAFIEHVLRLQIAEHSDVDAQCRAHGLSVDVLANRLPPSVTEAFPSRPPERRREARRALRERYGGGGVVGYADLSPAGEAMDRLGNRHARPEPDDLERLLAASRDDPAALAFLARCYAHACPHIAAQSPERRIEVTRRAAQIGDQLALTDVVGYLRERRQLAEAYAWARFAQWLAGFGCGWFPDLHQYVEASIAVRDIGAQLHAAERVDAERRAAELIAVHGPAARAVQYCSD